MHHIQKLENLKAQSNRITMTITILLPSRLPKSNTMKIIVSGLLLIATTSPALQPESMNRRSWLSLVATAAVSPLFPKTASASTVGAIENVYFGVGCFWHIQHEFVVAERELLGRDDSALTARTGYAGGKAADKDGRVCYHNPQSVADYGRLGHGEVVGLSLPPEKIVDFSEVYFSLFNPRTKGKQSHTSYSCPTD